MATQSEDLSGKVVVITGSNSGIGKESAVALAAMGATVVMTARDQAKGDAAFAEVRARSGSDDVVLGHLDLASFASIRSFASWFLERFDRLDVLIANAGLIMDSRRETAEGFEMMFGVNHLGHFLLTNLLRPQLAAADAARVVVVSSDAHKFARRGLDFDDLQSTQRYRALRVYGASKLANLLFAREAAARWAGDGITVNALHPGFVATRLGRDGDGGKLGDIVAPLLRPFARTPEKGAVASIHLATSPSVAGVTGDYFVDTKARTPAATALDEGAARRLWDISERLVGLG